MLLINYRKIILTGISILFAIQLVQAQTYPLGAHYYMNKYLGNPAFAGEQDGASIFLGIRKKMEGIPGAPIEQALVGQIRIGRAGFGLNLNNEKAGIIRQTRAVASYAYHLPLKGTSNLHFGISVGALSEKISEADIIGDPNDPQVGVTNRRDTYIDGDFGVAYTDNKLTIQASLPNLNSIFNKNYNGNANVSSLYTAASVKLSVASDVQIEPRVGFRLMKETDNTVDLGTRVGFINNQISIFGMYHSSDAFSFGFGALTLKEKFTVQGIYTTATSGLRGTSNGNFELNLKYNLF